MYIFIYLRVNAKKDAAYHTILRENNYLYFHSLNSKADNDKHLKTFKCFLIICIPNNVSNVVYAFSEDNLILRVKSLLKQ